MITILNAGLLTTVQDTGRYGYQDIGVSPSGAMDILALKLGNFLNGNPENAAGLEITLAGFSCCFNCDTTIALTGADLDYRINDYPVPMYKTLYLNKGDMLSTHAVKWGCRGYLTVLNGIAVTPVLNSAATDLKAKFGGFQARRLLTGDILHTFKNNTALAKAITISKALQELLYKSRDYAVIPGLEKNLLKKSSLNDFYNSSYTVSLDANRMGYRLNGPSLNHLNAADILSSAVNFGTIQVPGSGLPIIMMADRQPTGGYTRIGQIASADWSSLAQLKPNDILKFKKTTVEKAQQRLNFLLNSIEDLKRKTPPSRKQYTECKRYTIKVKNKSYHLKVEY